MFSKSGKFETMPKITPFRVPKPAPKRTKTASRGTGFQKNSWFQDAPKMPQKGPKRAPGWTEMGQDCFKNGPRHFKMALRWSKMAPKYPKKDKDEPKRAEIAE